MKTKENIRDARDYVRQHPIDSKDNSNSGYRGFIPNADNRPSEYPTANEHRQQHDYGSWGNSSFTQNTSARELGRVNSRFDRFQSRLGRHRPHQTEQGHYDLSYYNDDASGEARTWDEKGNESYQWEESGKQAQHSHAGKGPKGYKRSDERISEDVHQHLSDDHFLDASEIEVSVAAGDVVLTGTVRDKTDKRRAEDIAESVSGVTNVENRIRVNRVKI